MIIDYVEIKDTPFGILLNRIISSADLYSKIPNSSNIDIQFSVNGEQIDPTMLSNTLFGMLKEQREKAIELGYKDAETDVMAKLKELLFPHSPGSEFEW